MFSYGQLEAAIRSLHDVPPERAGTFKARIRHFQRIGLVPSSPGKGQKLDYTALDAVRWALCFEFAELATPPEIVKRMLRIYGKSIWATFALPTPEEDVFFWCEARFFEEAMTGTGHGKSYSGFASLRELRDRFNELKERKKHDINRVIMINLTHLKHELGKALGIDWEAPRHLLGRISWEG